MGEYFRGWKRKAGVMLLLPACVFAVGWIRSLSSVDSFDSRLLPNATLRSHLGEIYCYSQSGMSSPGDPMFGWWTGPASTVGFQEFEGDWGAIGFGYTKSPTGVVIGLPYWSIVIPLTWLSARLLLFKRRQPEVNFSHVNSS